MNADHKQSLLEQLRQSAPAKAIDKAVEATDHFLGPSGKAWLANGLDELRQVFTPGVEQIQPGNNPGLWGTITTGEATFDRVGTLDEMRNAAKAHEMGQTHEHDRGLER